MVVPFFNEAQNAMPLLEEIDRAMTSLGAYEIIAIDDCSTDGTAAVLAKARSDREQTLVVVAHARNLGQSAALASGVDRARAPWIVTLDGDGQNDPGDIPALVATLGSTPGPAPDLVCGHRQKRQDNALRRVSSRIANGVRSRLLRDATPDTGCGLKLVRRAVYKRLPRFDHMHRFLPALVRREGGVTISVPVSHRPRLHGRSSYGVWNRLGVGIVDLLGVMWLNRRALSFTQNRDKQDDG